MQYIVKSYNWPNKADCMKFVEGESAEKVLRQELKGTIPNWNTYLHYIRNTWLKGIEKDNASVFMGGIGKNAGVAVWNAKAKEYPIPEGGKVTMIRKKKV